MTFWEASSQIRLAPPLVAAASDLYARNILALGRQIEESGGMWQDADEKALCVHWRRTDFET
jgi:hypothetical protein